MKNILIQYSEEICRNCKKKKECKEKLYIKINKTVKCNEYERGAKK